MKQPVYRLIVESVMKRMPGRDEQPEDFFIGLDRYEQPFLLLPTPDELFGKNDIFTVRFLRDPLNKFHYTMDRHFTLMSLDRFEKFYDDKTFYFGPNENMLVKFLQGETYQTYTEWIHNLYTKKLYDMARTYLKAYDEKRTNQQIS